MTNSNIKIVQCSKPHTGSTLLLNLIHGYICPDEEIHWNTEKLINQHCITKTHDVDIDKWIKKYPQYKIIFIGSNRDKHPKISEKYNKYDNVLVIDYNDINETATNSLEKIVNFTFDKFRKIIPDELRHNNDDAETKKNMITRITNMNKLTKDIQNKPFAYWDRFYGIHGSHQNRKK